MGGSSSGHATRVARRTSARPTQIRYWTCGNHLTEAGRISTAAQRAGIDEVRAWAAAEAEQLLSPPAQRGVVAIANAVVTLAFPAGRRSGDGCPRNRHWLDVEHAVTRLAGSGEKLTLDHLKSINLALGNGINLGTSGAGVVRRFSEYRTETQGPRRCRAAPVPRPGTPEHRAGDEPVTGLADQHPPGSGCQRPHRAPGDELDPAEPWLPVRRPRARAHEPDVWAGKRERRARTGRGRAGCDHRRRAQPVCRGRAGESVMARKSTGLHARRPSSARHTLKRNP